MTAVVPATPPLTSGSPRSFRIAMLPPGALVTFVLILFALGLVLFLGFRVNDGSLTGAGFTPGNFIIVPTDPLYVTVAIRSVVIAGLVTLATVITAYRVRPLSRATCWPDCRRRLS